MNSSEEFDLVVIGGGSGGYAAARTAFEKSAKIAVIDNAVELGEGFAYCEAACLLRL